MLLEKHSIFGTINYNKMRNCIIIIRRFSSIVILPIPQGGYFSVIRYVAFSRKDFSNFQVFLERVRIFFAIFFWREGVRLSGRAFFEGKKL